MRYFEHTLGWDFKKVWIWDDVEDRPALRPVDVGQAAQTARADAVASPESATEPLLARQLRANLWL